MDPRIVAFAEMMNVSDFLSTCLCLDLEARGDRLYRIGAVLGGASFERKGRFPLDRAVEALDAFGRDARHVLGHNVLGHDLPLLHRLFPRLRILRKSVVDTLFLSPLAFPQNPYHRLVKDYKLVSESLNDPVADARLAASVFGDQWESFAHALSRGEGRLLSLYRYCFEAASFAGGLSHGGLPLVFDALGVVRIGRPGIGEHEAGELSLDQAAEKGAGYSVQPIRRGGDDDFRHNDFREVYTIISETVGDRVCEAALATLLNRETFHEKDLPALAYSVAWLQVAGSNSVLPPWVRHGFPVVRDILRVLRDVPCGEPSCEYCRAVHDPSSQLRRYFGFSGFRSSPVMQGSALGLQEAVVRHGMGDKPLLAILPTGGGKSLCYQLPALVRHFRRGALTIVISPLQALMKDQVDNLIARTGMMSTAALYGLLTPPERGEVLERVKLGDIAILYVAPEQLRNASFRKTISQREIGAWVFDEAHCLSKWGHDFRPDYLYAGRFIREFSAAQKTTEPPIACFTATAKLDVKKEIIEYFIKELGQSLEVFEGSVERENLHFQVQMVTRA
jgi:ATP-dependent DNA helicase RecQ